MAYGEPLGFMVLQGLWSGSLKSNSSTFESLFLLKCVQACWLIMTGNDKGGNLIHRRGGLKGRLKSHSSTSQSFETGTRNPAFYQVEPRSPVLFTLVGYVSWRFHSPKWRCQEWNLGPFACKTNVLPLSYELDCSYKYTEYVLDLQHSVMELLGGTLYFCVL